MTAPGDVQILYASGAVCPGKETRGMRMFTTDPAEVRRWAEGRGARPGLTASGDLVLWMPGEADRGPVLRWDEFAGHFTAERMAFVFDEMPGSGFWVIGREDEVRQFAEEAVPEMLA